MEANGEANSLQEEPVEVITVKPLWLFETLLNRPMPEPMPVPPSSLPRIEVLPYRPPSDRL